MGRKPKLTLYQRAEAMRRVEGGAGRPVAHGLPFQGVCGGLCLGPLGHRPRIPFCDQWFPLI